jgi:hypothetical protein
MGELNLIIYSSLGMDESAWHRIFKNIKVDKLNITMVGCHNNYSKNIPLDKDKIYFFFCGEVFPSKKHVTYVKYICELIGKNRIYVGFESLGHPSHMEKWSMDLFSGFDVVYNSYYKIVDGKKYKWIPGYCWLLGYHPTTELIKDYNKYCTNLNPKNKKVKFMVNNPINGSNPLRNYLTIRFLDKSISNQEEFNFYGREEWISFYLKHKKLLNYFYYPCKKELYDSNERSTNDQSVLCRKKQSIFTYYKFILTIENIPETYISEKFIDSIYSNSVPIYFGQANIDKVFPDIFKNGAINGFSLLTESEKKEFDRIKDSGVARQGILTPLILNYKNPIVDNAVDRIVKKLKLMSKTEYYTRIKTIQKYRDKYLGMFHIGPVHEYAVIDGVFKCQPIQLECCEDSRKFHESLIETNKRINSNNMNNREPVGPSEKFIQSVIAKKI